MGWVPIPELISCGMYKMAIPVRLLHYSKGRMISQNSLLPTSSSQYYFSMSTPVWPLLLVTSSRCQVHSCWAVEATSNNALLWSPTCFQSGIFAVWRLHSKSVWSNVLLCSRHSFQSWEFVQVRWWKTFLPPSSYEHASEFMQRPTNRSARDLRGSATLRASSL